MQAGRDALDAHEYVPIYLRISIIVNGDIWKTMGEIEMFYGEKRENADLAVEKMG